MLVLFLFIDGGIMCSLPCTALARAVRRPGIRQVRGAAVRGNAYVGDPGVSTLSTVMNKKYA